MKRAAAFCLLTLPVLALIGCSSPSGYENACVMGKNTVRGDCDKPGQSEESKDYQPR